MGFCLFVFCKGGRNKNRQITEQCKHKGLFCLQSFFVSTFFKEGFIDSLLSFYLLSGQKLCICGSIWEQKSSLCKKRSKTSGWNYFTVTDSVKNARACNDYPSVCNKNSDPICNSHSNRKEIKPLSTSWSPVNWNLSFPLLLTCNQTGEISVNLFPNILAMS